MKRWMLLAVLAVVFVQGLVRVAVVPLWRHYDEPAHYEYVRFLVEDRRLPRIGDADPAILERIGESDRSIVLCQSVSGPVRPGACLAAGDAFIQPPAYYLLQAAVQRVVAPRTTQGQVRLGRLVSVLLSVGIALLAFLTARVVRPSDPDLALAAAALTGALPGYVDLMSALSNDVGAVAAFSLFVFAAVRLIRLGNRPVHLAQVAAAAGLCLLVKATAAIALPLALVGVWLAAGTKIPRALRWGAPALAAVLGLFLAMDFGWPARWFPFGPFPAVRRVEVTGPGGEAGHAISVTEDGKHRPVLWQLVSEDGRRALADRGGSLGAWMRSPDAPVLAPLPVLCCAADACEGPSAVVTPEWSFHSYRVSVPQGDGPIAVTIPEVRTGVAQYTGILLVPGGERFVNLVSNASAAEGWPILRPGVDYRMPGGGLNYRLPALFGRRGWPAYGSALRWQFITYWAGFGTGAAYGPRALFVALGLLTAISAVGVAVHGRRARPGADEGAHARCLVFLVLAVACSLVMSLLRLDPPDADGKILHPISARYVYVSIVPAMSLLALGWGAWWPGRWRRLALAALVLGVLAVGIWLLLGVQIPSQAS